MRVYICAISLSICALLQIFSQASEIAQESNPLNVKINSSYLFSIEKKALSPDLDELTLLINIPNKESDVRIPLTNSNYEYILGGKKYSVNLWPAGPPDLYIPISAKYILLLTRGEISDNGFAHYGVNPLYAGILNLNNFKLESVMSGNFLTISHDIQYPTIIMVESLFTRNVNPPNTTDPIFYYWQPGKVNPARFQNLHPSETVPKIAFPITNTTNVGEIGGFRLLSNPVWAPDVNKIAFIAYDRDKKNEAHLYVIEFHQWEDKPKYFMKNIPVIEHTFIENLINNDKIGYLTGGDDENSPIRINWNDNSKITVIFSNQRHYEIDVKN